MAQPDDTLTQRQAALTIGTGRAAVYLALRDGRLASLERAEVERYRDEVAPPPGTPRRNGHARALRARAAERRWGGPPVFLSDDEIRARQGNAPLTQVEAARLLGCSQPMVHYYLRTGKLRSLFRADVEALKESRDV